MKVKIVAPDGKKLRDLRNENLYSEVIVDESKKQYFVVADSEDDPVITVIDGVTLDERVSDLEDAVIELAELIVEGA